VHFFSLWKCILVFSYYYCNTAVYLNLQQYIKKSLTTKTTARTVALEHVNKSLHVTSWFGAGSWLGYCYMVHRSWHVIASEASHEKRVVLAPDGVDSMSHGPERRRCLIRNLKAVSWLAMVPCPECWCSLSPKVRPLHWQWATSLSTTLKMAYTL
jgi:hypothetical protein